MFFIFEYACFRIVHQHRSFSWTVKVKSWLILLVFHLDKKEYRNSVSEY